MVELKQLYQDLKQLVPRAEQEAEQLNEDEEKEMKYLNREDVPRSLEIFSEEVDLAVQLTEHIEEAEEDELKAEELFKESDVPEEVRERFMESEQSLEELVKKALEEMQTLKKEAEMLENEIQNSDVPQEAVEEFRTDRQELKQALNNMQQIKQEGETMMDRREFLIGTAAAGATAAGIGKITVEQMDKFQKHVKKQQQEAMKQIQNSQQATENEAAKPDTEVKKGNGKLRERTQIGEGLEAEITVIRTSADTALTSLKIHNTSNESKKLDIKLEIKNWMFSGHFQWGSSDANHAERKVEIPAGNYFELGSTLAKANQSEGMLEYEIVTKSNQFEQVQLNPPNSIVDGQTVSPDNLKGLEVNQKLDSETKYAEKELQIDVKNTSRTTKMIYLSVQTPSGWTVSGTENVNQGGGGLYATRDQVGKGDSFKLDLHINKQSRGASPVGTLSVIEVPDGKPSQANYYLVPVVLEE